MMLLDPAVDDAARAKIVADAKAAIESGGTLLGHHDWGARAMTYEIDHREQAEYHLLQFHATPALLESLGRSLRINDGVIRHRIIKLAPGTPAAPEVRHEPAVAAAAPPRAAVEAAEPAAG
jgi:small subunit ribosomal protein S6